MEELKDKLSYEFKHVKSLPDKLLKKYNQPKKKKQPKEKKQTTQQDADEYYKDFGITKLDKEVLEQQKINNLYKIPKKDKGFNMPRYQQYDKDDIHEADLLTMPIFNKFKYILMVVDIGSRLCDAEPIRGKDTQTVLNALKKIYDRDVLKIPNNFSTDGGSEFKGLVAEYLKDNNVNLMLPSVGRSNSNAVVERYNQMVATSLFKYMTAIELKTNKKFNNWIDKLPIVISSINKKKKQQMKDGEIGHKYIDAPLCNGNSCEVLPIGTKVRHALLHPIDNIDNKRLHGGFRSTDIRFDPKERIIKHIIMRPNQTIMYLLDSNTEEYDPQPYTKNQLQVIPENEYLPDIQQQTKYKSKKKKK